MARILIIDDDSYICTLLEKFFSNKGYSADTAMSAQAAEKKFNSSFFDIIFCDNRLPDGNGLKLLKKIKAIHPETFVIIISAYADIRSVVQLMKAGAFDYATKPLHTDELLELTERIMQQKKRSMISTPFNEKFITGESEKMKKIMKLANLIAPTDVSVLIEGETGSGKEYIARSIHLKSHRKEQPFIAVDCGAIPRDLANSELFGHIKGSFTGAINNKIGVFEQAKGGTIFLDEIGNLNYDVQIKLLRAIQERVITRVGGENNIRIDVRIITATNESLENYIQKRQFREDLYHRINEFKIQIPPLRERKEDILIYANHFMHTANKDLKRNVKQFDIEVIRMLQMYPWQGNLRELRNAIKRAVLLANDDTITIDCFPEEIINFHTLNKTEANYSGPPKKTKPSTDLKDAANQFEKEIIIKVLRDVNYNKSKAAKILNIDRKTLYNKMKVLEIDYK